MHISYEYVVDYVPTVYSPHRVEMYSPCRTRNPKLCDSWRSGERLQPVRKKKLHSHRFVRNRAETSSVAGKHKRLDTFTSWPQQCCQWFWLWWDTLVKWTARSFVSDDELLLRTYVWYRVLALVVLALNKEKGCGPNSGLKTPTEAIHVGSGSCRRSDRRNSARYELMNPPYYRISLVFGLLVNSNDGEN